MRPDDLEALLAIPSFLQRVAGDVEPPREVQRKRWTKRTFEAAHRKAAETKRREAKLAKKARERAMAEYRRVFGPGAPEPDKGTAEQRLLYEEALAAERLRMKGARI